MTASSILGFIPLVASSGAGSELYRGMGAVQLGGMALSTLFTLVLVPTIFSLWIDAKAGLLSLAGRKPKELNGNGHRAEADVSYSTAPVRDRH
jgi:HAE1 family hydrophobic/amphiphilic exporter-1